MTIGRTNASAQPALDATLTIALAVASKAAYDYYQGQPFQSPDGYQQIDAWTGWDAFLISGSEEKYGLVFQSIAAPGTLIFAFRGTDSDMDIYEDVRFLTTDFVPTRGSIAPTPRVASGFYSIYDDKGGQAQSMREQLFALLAKYQPSQLYVTGHSLGAALSQLFSLDLAVSQPMSASNINFASPMVGTIEWQTAYNATIAPADSIRVYNYWDYVPTLPPSDLGFHAVGSAFQTAFYVKGEWFPHELSRHSVVNLTTVLSHALPASPQQWVGQFPDYVQPKWTMQSKLPPAGAVNWADKIGEHMRFERLMDAAA
ncbi:lipase family protein [Lysobacter antibioticus]|uniref:Lipase family protein n=1 Tax=Lysobacter antibioticus TaxID=84531 RepID=A0A0S2FCI8_LYSAN|nr:lipase family protein [Lysobacter antibioticus]ALN81232.1 lipase family protein [Lysobacter antibioticus]